MGRSRERPNGGMAYLVHLFVILFYNYLFVFFLILVRGRSEEVPFKVSQQRAEMDRQRRG